MELKLFTDLIDALGKIAGGLKAIVNLPKAEREAIRRTLDETYRLIDTTLNMAIIRLGDVQLQAADEDFLREARVGWGEVRTPTYFGDGLGYTLGFASSPQPTNVGLYEGWRDGRWE